MVAYYICERGDIIMEVFFILGFIILWLGLNEASDPHLVPVLMKKKSGH
jgi:hypothetical protein